VGKICKSGSPRRSAFEEKTVVADLVQVMHVLLVEDEASVAEPLAQALRRDGFVPTVVSTAAGALQAARRQEFDFVILDLTLPDGDGRDVCREIRRDSRVPLIMLTARGTELDKIVGLELGADDYVVKPFSSAELLARMRAILRRAGGPADGLRGPVQIGALELDERSRRASIDGLPIPLTLKEFDLLARLVREAGRVVRREDLMSDVWDENWFGSMKTLDVHISTLRRKIGDDPSQPRYLHTVRGVGFRLAAPEEAAT
jgi:two-component system response regulator RegX3